MLEMALAELLGEGLGRSSTPTTSDGHGNHCRTADIRRGHCGARAGLGYRESRCRMRPPGSSSTTVSIPILRKNG